MKSSIIMVFTSICLDCFPLQRPVLVNKGLVIKKTQAMQQILIDKFTVPEDAEKEFTARMQINRDLIRTLPGFIEDAAYRRHDEQHQLIYVTVAIWENDEAIKKAKEAVQSAYQKEGFNMPAMLEKWKVKFDRGIYEKM